MNRKELIEQLQALLEEHESAPSAVVACLYHLVGEAANDEACDQAYETSEAANDAFRDAMLNWMTDEQLQALKQDIMSEIAEQELLDA